MQQQLDAIQLKEKGHDLDQQIADVQKQIADAQNGTTDAIDQQTAAVEKQNAAYGQQAQAVALITDYHRKSLRERIQDNLKPGALAVIGVNGPGNAALDAVNKTTAAKQKSNDVDLEGLQLKLQDLQTQKALFDQVDQGAKVQADSDQRKLDAQKQNNDLTQEEKRVKNEISALPLEQQVQRIKEEQQAATKPLKDQLDTLQRQSDNLNQQRKQWQLLKSDISDALQPLEQAAADAKTAAGKAGAGSGAAGPSVTLGAGDQRLPTQPLAAGTGPEIKMPTIDAAKIGADFAERIGKGIKNYVKEHWGSLIGGAIGGDTRQRIRPNGRDSWRHPWQERREAVSEVDRGR